MTIITKRLLRPVLVGSLATVVNCASCAPDSEVGNDLLHFLTGVTSGGADSPYPDYPPYDMGETTEGNSRHPINIVAWDGVDNRGALVNGIGSRERTWATINGTNESTRYDGVENALIVEFDHVIGGNNHKGATGDDLRIVFVPPTYDSKKNYIGDMCLAFPGTAMWKPNGRNGRIQYNGWDKWELHRIHYFDVYGSYGNSLSLNVEDAVRNAGRGSRYIAIFNLGTNPIRVQSIVDLNAD